MSITTGSVDSIVAAQPGHMAAHDRVLAEEDEYEYVEQHQREEQEKCIDADDGNVRTAMNPSHRTSAWRRICAQEHSRGLRCVKSLQRARIMNNVLIDSLGTLRYVSH